MNKTEAALLSLDAYHRYTAPDDLLVPFGADVILETVEEDFAAVAYHLHHSNEIVIAYRGTDGFGDATSGWFVGAGDYDQIQAREAFDFYNTLLGVLSNSETPHPANGLPISFTGHSLGGGLAGLVASVTGHSAIIFNSMPFTEAANSLFADMTGEQAATYAEWQSRAYPDGVAGAPSFADIDSYAIRHEVLSALRWGGEVILPIELPIRIDPTNGEDSTRIFQNEYQAGSVASSVDRHSQALLTIAVYGDAAVGSVRHNGGYSTYHLLTDQAFATALGFADHESLRLKLAYTIGQSTQVALDSLFEDMDVFGALHSASGVPNPYLDAMAKVSLTQSVAIARGEIDDATIGIVQHSNGTANVTLDGVYEGLLADFLRFTNVSATDQSVILGRDLSNIAVSWSPYGGTAYLTPGGTLYFGTQYFDEIFGSDEADVIYSGGTDETYHDEIWGGGGDDLIYSSAGNDIIDGGDGSDRIYSGLGKDVVAGGAGADQISDPDWLVVDYSLSDSGVRLARSAMTDRSIEGFGGHAQGDIISLGGTNTRFDVIGSGYQDHIFHAYEVHAGGGNDVITGGKIIFTGGDYDTVNVSGDTDYVNFETGGGELKLANSLTGYSVDMAQGKYHRVGSAGQTLHELTVVNGFNKLTGSNLSDTIYGTAGDETIIGGGGYDTVYGRAGNDTITITSGKAYGGDDNDTITVGKFSEAHGDSGIDTLVGGQGSKLYGGSENDIITLNGAGGLVVGGSGADTITFASGGSYAESTLSYADSSGGITLFATGLTAYGAGGDAEGDVIHGRFHLSATSSADTLTLYGSDYGVYDAGGGDDIVTLSIGGTLHAGAGNDTITLNARGAVAYGDEGNDTFYGVGTMHGGLGDDTFYLSHQVYRPGAFAMKKAGGTVHAGSGNNLIFGGEGTDAIFMAEGANTFVFFSGGNQDTVIGAGADDHFVLWGVDDVLTLSDLIDNLYEEAGSTKLMLPDDAGGISFVGLNASQVAGLSWEFL